MRTATVVMTVTDCHLVMLQVLTAMRAVLASSVESLAVHLVANMVRRLGLSLLASFQKLLRLLSAAYQLSQRH